MKAPLNIFTREVDIHMWSAFVFQHIASKYIGKQYVKNQTVFVYLNQGCTT